MPKISCQEGVEIIKNIPEERISEWMGEKSGIIEVPKTSC